MTRQSLVPLGVAHFERYLGIVCELHIAPSHPVAVSEEQLELCLESGYRSLKGVLQLCGASLSAAGPSNKLILDDDWQGFISEVHSRAYEPSRGILPEEGWLIGLLKPNPLLFANAASRFGRPQRFLFSHLMEDVPVAETYAPTIERIDIRRRVAYRAGKAS